MLLMHAEPDIVFTNSVCLSVCLYNAGAVLILKRMDYRQTFLTTRQTRC